MVDACGIEGVQSLEYMGDFHLALKQTMVQAGLQQCDTQAEHSVLLAEYVHIRSRSMVPPDQCHFLRSNTQTDPSDALAPTLSPVAFQQTSKMPPVPR